MEYVKKIDWRNLSCTKVLIFLNILVFLLVEITGISENPEHLLAWGASYGPYLEAGQYYRLFTSMFLHFGMEHLLNNMLLLYVIGEPLERAVGRIRFLIICLSGGIIGNVVSWYAQRGNGVPHVSAGASGVVFAAIGGMILVLLANRGRVERLTLRQMLIMAGLSLYFGLTSRGVDNWAHAGGLAGGFLIALVIYRRKNVTG